VRSGLWAAMQRGVEMEITAPGDLTQAIGKTGVFLAGGITDCPNWQRDAVEYLGEHCPGLVVFNPRRDNWDMNAGPDASKAQIKWEHEAISLATSHLFWFCVETVQPIVLYELGKVQAMGRNLFTGAHPGYPRRLDVVTQLELLRESAFVHTSLENLLHSVRIAFDAGILRRQRPSWDSWFLKIAEEVSERATCPRGCTA
ncbi:MAG: hypothetical protein IH955_11740, partial [Chloroflexi bacterium]|nr:hypothetical protein [Chloroflexota bacterium]